MASQSAPSSTQRASGPLAKGNSFRFSTKYQDDETGLIYYGHRYYSPILGRWICRDPANERGGLNLYGFCLNNSLRNVDRNGLDIYEFRREAEGTYGLLDHSFVIITTGDYDERGRPINFIVNFDETGESVTQTDMSVGVYTASHRDKSADLRVVQGMNTTRAESRALIEYFKATAPNEKYNFLLNNCRSVYLKAEYLLFTVLYDDEN